MFEFEIKASDAGSNARAATLNTPHGVIETPVFMPVGTQATVKAVDQQVLKEEINAPIILGNTYHLYLRPGIDILREAGGLHKFMNWDRALLTDSGGFQVYSISEQRKIKEDGVHFRSHIDGQRILFTPENVIDTQRAIGADIIMAFDECTPFPCTYEYADNSMGITHRWLDRCMDRMNSSEPLYGHEQALFPIVQGSTYRDLRAKSAEYIAGKDAVGNAIGGLSVGEPHEEMYEMTDLVCSILPKSKPRYLMGVGTPSNLLECIALGIDMFDCVMPTRNARNGMLFTAEGTMNMRNKKWERDFSPIDTLITPQYTKAYLRHLVMSKEYLAAQIASTHNLKFYLWLIREARKHIIEGDFLAWKNKMVSKLSNKL